MNVDKMLHEQKIINDKFINMPIERLDDVVTLIVPPEECTVSKTRFFVDDVTGVLVIKRFIDRKLWSISFTNGLSFDKVNSWLELSDDKFMRIAKVEVMGLNDS